MNSNTKWCMHCKDSIRENSNYISKNGDYYHLFCYHQKLGIVLPLNFDEALFTPEDGEDE